MFKLSTIATSTALALSLGLSGAAVAQGGGAAPGQQAPGGQQGQPPAAQGQQQAPDIDVSDEQIEQFAEAQARVAEIGQKWTPRLQEAESREDVQEARQSAQKEMMIAVENSGLSVQEYNQIAQAAQADPELRERITQETSE